HHEGDVLQPAVAGLQVPGRHAPGPARQVRGAQSLPRPGPRAHDGGERWGRGRGALPRHRGAVLDADPGHGARARGRARRRARAAARRTADRRAAAGPAVRLTAVHLEGEEEQSVGRRRLAFDELLLVQLALLRRRRLRRAGSQAPVLDEAPALSARWLAEMLPFAPTADQRRAMEEIDTDLG